MVKEKENVYFAGVEKPDELRRNLLESTRDIVEVMKKFEKFKSLREEKVNEIKKLKSSMKEISKLISKLRSGLPQTKLGVKLHKRVPNEKEVVKKEVKKIKKKGMSELDKLESELGEIESKLKKLS